MNSAPQTVNEIVYQAVRDYTAGDCEVVFTISEIQNFLAQTRRGFNGSNVGCEITRDCVNAPSRHWYAPNRHDRYLKVARGKYCLYCDRRQAGDPSEKR